MDLRPKTDKADAGYPSSFDYHRSMRGMLACLAVAGGGVGADLCNAAEPTDEINETATKEAKPLTEDARKLVLAKIRKDVQEHAKKLGVDDFRVRRDATKRLIAIGNVCEKPDATKKPPRSAKLVKPYRELVIEEMQKLAVHKDPEVRERAKLVIKALTPKPVRRDPPMRLGGKMAIDVQR